MPLLRRPPDYSFLRRHTFDAVIDPARRYVKRNANRERCYAPVLFFECRRHDDAVTPERWYAPPQHRRASAFARCAR